LGRPATSCRKTYQNEIRRIEDLTSGSTNIFEEAINNVQAQTDADTAALEKRKQIVADSTQLPCHL